MNENIRRNRKASNTTDRENTPKIENQETPHKILRFSEILKSKKNSSIDMDLPSATKTTRNYFIKTSSKNIHAQINQEEEAKTLIQNNETKEKEDNTEKIIPHIFKRKRKYRLRTNEFKLPSKINLLQKLCDKTKKNEKQDAQPIFKFEEDESINNNNNNNISKNYNTNNNTNIININDVESDKNKNNQYNRKNNYRPKTIMQNYENRISETMSEKDKIAQKSVNQENKNLTYTENISNKMEAKNAAQYQNKYQNYNNNKFQNKENNELLENEMVKNSYYIKCKSLYIELSFMENMNAQFEDHMEDKSKSIINFNNNPYEAVLEIFDGHGGDKISTYLQANFSKIYKKFLDETQKNIEKSLSLAFSKLDDNLRQQPNIEDMGSTGTIIHIIRDKSDRLFVYNGNVGDSRASLISPRKIERLSKEHRASDKEEKKRILAEGGLIFHGRVNGELMLTRSFGDFSFKQNQNAKTATTYKKTASTGEVGRFRKGVICEPFITKIEIDQNVDNQFLFLASDGIWDVISEEEMQNLIKVNNDTHYLSSLIIEKALIRQAWDNLSIFVVKLT